ncbi:MAG: hypothetical protein KGJ39_00310 [Acidobacteriota bacterium]|nr:hypothetical protein [Acidobacteriota bacterium]
MSHDSLTRRELETSLRALLPATDPMRDASDQPATLATVGVGGLLTGYLWGRLRGRRIAKRRRR